MFWFPIWCHVAATGSANIAEHDRKRTAKEPQANPQMGGSRLINPKERQTIKNTARMSNLREERARQEGNTTPSPFEERQRLVDSSDNARRYVDEEAGRQGMNRAIAAVITHQKDARLLAEEPVRDQTAGDFAWSVFFIIFGCIALVAGLFSLGIKD